MHPLNHGKPAGRPSITIVIEIYVILSSFAVFYSVCAIPSSNCSSDNLQYTASMQHIFGTVALAELLCHSTIYAMCTYELRYAITAMKGVYSNEVSKI